MKKHFEHDFDFTSGKLRARDQRVHAVANPYAENPDLYQKAAIAVRTLEVLLERDWLTPDMREHLRAELDELLVDMSQRGL